MITTLLLTHHWSAPLGNNSVPDTKLNSTLHASPTVAIGHRRCSPFFELHNFGSGTPLTSVGTTPLQLLAQSGQLAHNSVVKVLHAIPLRHAEHAKTLLRGIRGTSDLLRQFSTGKLSGFLEHYSSDLRWETLILDLQGSIPGYPDSTDAPSAAARSLPVQ